MNGHSEPEVGRDTFGDVVPGITSIVRPIQSPVVLKKDRFWPRRMADDLVNALPKLRIAIGSKVGAHSLVTRLPGVASVIGPIDAGRGDGDMNSAWIGRVRKNRV